MNNIIIIGAGECGIRAAFALREAGFVGRLTVFGNEPHLPYQRPPLSKTHPVSERPIVSQVDYTALEIDLMRGRTVNHIDRARQTVALVGGEEYAYDKLLLATGARPRIFAAAKHAQTLRTVDDARAIMSAIAPGKHLAVIGGGFIGLEVAATAREIGAEVSVVEVANRLMARMVPADVAIIAQARHREKGVQLFLNAQVSAALPDRVDLFGGKTLKADLVVAGVGSFPNTELAREAGLVENNGIEVDACFQTTDPHIFAAGDCCNFPYRGARTRLESWRAARDQGDHVARAMLGDKTPYEKVPWLWSAQYDLTIQVAGLVDPRRIFHRRILSDDAFILYQFENDGTMVSASGIGPGNAVDKDIHLAEVMIERRVRADPRKLSSAPASLPRAIKD